jgi:hypothetical protein
MPVKVVPVCEPMSTKAAVEDVTGAKSAAVKGRTAAMEAAASAVESATTVVAAMTATVTTVTAMATSDFGRQPIGSMFRRRRRRWIDRRKRFGALAGRGRQHQHRGSRKTQRTNKAAPGIWNLHHA